MDITRKIEQIQSVTGSAILSIGEITGIIDQLHDISTTIAAAVEEQSTASHSISQSMSRAASGVDAITHHIGGVAEAANQASCASGEQHEAAVNLTALADELQRMLGKGR